MERIINKWDFGEPLKKSQNDRYEKSEYLEYFLDDLIWIWEEYYYLQEERKKILALNPVSYKIKQNVNNKILAQYHANNLVKKLTQERLYKQLRRYIELQKKVDRSDEELNELGKIEGEYHKLIYFTDVDSTFYLKNENMAWSLSIKSSLFDEYISQWINISKELEQKLLDFEKKVYNYFEIYWTKIGEMTYIVKWVAHELCKVLGEQTERIPENLRDLVK